MMLCIKPCFTQTIRNFAPHLGRAFKHRTSKMKYICRKYSINSKDEDMAHIRNIGIMAHIDAGKTTTTERMLYFCGFIKNLVLFLCILVGNVDDGNTVTDFLDEERERGITISSAAVTLHWNQHKINLIDTPGHVDFMVEVERSLRVLDGAVAVLDASAGVEAQTMTVWRQADHYNIPRIIYLNKMDKPRASIKLCLSSIREKLKAEPVLINTPFEKSETLNFLVDIINMKKIEWSFEKNPDGSDYKVKKLDQTKDKQLYDQAVDARNSLIGQLADNDETMADIVIAESNLDNIKTSDLIAALRRTTLSRKLVPVLCGSSLKNIGVQPLLDAITQYLPSPMDCHYDFVKHYQTDLCALAFKIVHDKYKGRLTFLRIYSGAISGNGTLYNVNRNKNEKIARLLQVYANEYHDINYIGAGNIACISGLQQTITGDTITSSAQAGRLAKLHSEYENSDGVEVSPVLAGVEVPSPVFYCSVEPPSLSTQKALDMALDCIEKEDPSFQVDFDKETGQTILRGMGELHLDVIKHRIQKQFGVDVYIGPVMIAYRESVEKTARVQEILDRHLDKKDHYVRLVMSVGFNPNIPVFRKVTLDRSENPFLSSSHLMRTLRAVNEGIKSGLLYGPLLSCRVNDVEVTLHDLEINGDKDKMHDVIHDLHRRRSHIENVTVLQDIEIIQAITPLAELMGYSSFLRKATSGMATFTMELSHYEKMSHTDQNKAIEKVTGFSPE
ncbi:hypothetical protein KUTeg_014090 [Tegillarca granosa]|uniref:Tr-type G domain-containing protein n=1 Tax=Tegillarca granosa TaxID=220873 RepID=A0ABQ9EVK9_TEGGR|nr:hypothetical protein KUTeg_014090 [Tegillarca granosa]